MLVRSCSEEGFGIDLISLSKVNSPKVEYISDRNVKVCGQHSMGVFLTAVTGNRGCVCGLSFAFCVMKGIPACMSERCM